MNYNYFYISLEESTSSLILHLTLLSVEWLLQLVGRPTTVNIFSHFINVLYVDI